MNAEKFNKIIIVSLYEKFSEEVGNLISHELGMLFCSAKDLMDYEIIDRKAVEEKCSVAYLKKLEKKVIKQIASFVNVCVAISYERFVENALLFKDSGLVVFVDLPKTYLKTVSTPNYLRFIERRETLKNLSTLIISVRKVDADSVKEKILCKLGGIV